MGAAGASGRQPWLRGTHWPLTHVSPWEQLTVLNEHPAAGFRGCLLPGAHGACRGPTLPLQAHCTSSRPMANALPPTTSVPSLSRSSPRNFGPSAAPSNTRPVVAPALSSSRTV